MKLITEILKENAEKYPRETALVTVDSKCLPSAGAEDYAAKRKEMLWGSLTTPPTAWQISTAGWG